MTLDQLYYFKKLAELEHYTNAASELYISQPSLSLSIKNLEEELGASLFQKKGRNVALTTNGKDFYNCVSEVFTILNNGISALKHNIDSTSGKISIGTIPILAGNFISEKIVNFMKFYPQTKFDIYTCMGNKEVLNGIHDGLYDIGFCFKAETVKDLVFIPMLKQELVVITKVGHKLSKKDQLKLTDLLEYPLITYRENNPLGIFIRKLFLDQKLVPKIAYAFDEDITISEMVARDIGIAVLANIPLLRNYLSIIPLYINAESPVLYLAYRKTSSQPKAIQEFISFLNTNALIS